MDLITENPYLLEMWIYYYRTCERFLGSKLCIYWEKRLGEPVVDDEDIMFIK